MTDFVRVSLPESKSEASVSAAFAKTKGLKVLDQPAERGGRALAPTREGGRPLKPRNTVAVREAEANVAVADPVSDAPSAAGGKKQSGVAAKPKGANA